MAEKSTKKTWVTVLLWSTSIIDGVVRGRYSGGIRKSLGRWSNVKANPPDAELFASSFRHLKLELQTQFPASKDE